MNITMHKTICFVVMILLSASMLTQATLIGPTASSYTVLTGGTFGADKEVVIDGLVGASGNIWLNKDTSISSGVYTSSGFGADKDVSIGGDVVYGTDFWADNSAAISGSVLSSPDSWNAVSFSNPGISSGNDNLWYARNSVVTLTPGSYSNLSVDRGSTVYLSAGDYTFNSVWLDREVRVIADTSSGAVTFSSAAGLSTGSDLTIERNGSNILIVQSGTSMSLGDNAVIDAALRSWGTMDIGKESRIAGSLYAAEDLWLSKQVVIDGSAMPMVPTPEPATLVMLAAGAAVVSRRKRKVS